MESIKSFKKYIGVFLICVLIVSVILYINEYANNSENTDESEITEIENVENTDNVEVIESRNFSNGEVVLMYSNYEYKMMVYDKTYSLYTSAKVYPNYRYTAEKIENKVNILNIIEFGDSLVIETYQNVETVDLYNYLYFYNGELVVQDYISKHGSYDTTYNNNMYAINGELNGLEIFDLNTGERIYNANIHQANIVEVGDGYICFDDDTFINLNSEDKKLECAWVYLEKEINDENKLNEYKILDNEMSWIFGFDEYSENGELVYSVNDYVDGVITQIYTIYIPLE